RRHTVAPYPLRFGGGAISPIAARGDPLSRNRVSLEVALKRPTLEGLVGEGARTSKRRIHENVHAWELYLFSDAQLGMVCSRVGGCGDGLECERRQARQRRV